ncbi:MAG TPA: hypothetical protein VKA60_13295 [Blastocatellia bacterium]|nr:hypothetical protein [Blastocatellia bacterium]
MASTCIVTDALRGMFCDELYDGEGRLVWQSGWRNNTIVDDCRRLLAGFMHGTPVTVKGIQGLRVGAGLAAWDNPPGPPKPGANQAALVQPFPDVVIPPDLAIDFLDPSTGTTTLLKTNRIQVVATLGPGVPSGPSPVTLREFGLAAELDGTGVLINYVTHPAIVKDPTSTLKRTIWLVF